MENVKNLAFAVAGLITIIIAIFLLTTRDKGGGDTVIPSPIPIESDKVDFVLPSSTKSVDSKPFDVLTKEKIRGKRVLIEINKGNIEIELSENSPIASSNFIYLVEKEFYAGLTFHRVEKSFVVQGGDPKGDGTGGPGYSFIDEPVVGDYVRGVVAMANAGSNTNGSQFFIMLADALSLPKQYTIFGKVVKGMDVVDKLGVGDVMRKVELI